MKITVDLDLCIGAANCVALAPTVFDLNDEGKAYVLDPTSADDETIMEAAENCPTQAIILEGDDGRQFYP